MSWTPHESELPSSDHLRDDINVPGPEPESAAELSEDAYTSTELNAGQQVPGLSPSGEYRRDLNPDHQAGRDADGLDPEES
ncbi:hypothetical protein [Arthrobacter sp. Br18]|uniref:hypothetical protein n=1 Tax=Arthrobacter sp. Br18 TaxID=1312954 RepID=UPI0004B723C4|nr:hypothetical protein [Arthrobacter sp. Br18]